MRSCQRRGQRTYPCRKLCMILEYFQPPDPPVRPVLLALPLLQKNLPKRRDKTIFAISARLTIAPNPSGKHSRVRTVLAGCMVCDAINKPDRTQCRAERNGRSFGRRGGRDNLLFLSLTHSLTNPPFPFPPSLAARWMGVSTTVDWGCGDGVRTLRTAWSG